MGGWGGVGVGAHWLVLWEGGSLLAHAACCSPQRASLCLSVYDALGAALGSTLLCFSAVPSCFVPQVVRLVDEVLEMTELTALQHSIVGEGQGGQVRRAAALGLNISVG